MKNRIFILMVLLATSLLHVNAKIVFTVDGPEESYNQIRVINETTHDTLRCRLVVLKDDGSTDWLYGIYELKGKGDSDTNTNSKKQKIKRGARIGIELPKDFDGEVSYALEYRDIPLFDIVVVHLYDKGAEFNEE